MSTEVKHKHHKKSSKSKDGKETKELKHSHSGLKKSNSSLARSQERKKPAEKKPEDDDLLVDEDGFAIEVEGDGDGDDFYFDDDDGPILADDDDYDGYGVDDGAFEIVEKEQSNYSVLNSADIVASQQVAIKSIADLFSIPEPIARLLLVHSKWNADSLIDRYTGGEEDKIFKESGVPNPKEQKKITPLNAKKQYECTICMEDYDGSKMKQFVCGHIFCADCWQEYLVFTISNGQVTAISCPSRGCSVQLDELTISNMIGNKKDLLEKYHRLASNAYVNDSKNIRWCPGSGCENAIKVQILKEPLVQCSCGTKFCFQCGSLPHVPTTCRMLADWNSKSQKDEASAKWIAAYTKECPKCHNVIHKDGGCQYMSCTKCQHKFCWICLGNFDHKDHACNKLNADKSLDPNSERAQLNKYTHFLNRYNIHQQSINLEEKLVALADKVMQELLDKGMTWADVKFVKDATVALMECRNILKNTYIYGFYLPQKTNRDIFEHLQADLEQGVERLSALLEDKGPKDKMKIMNATDYVRQRQKTLCEGLMEGDISGGTKSVEKVFASTENEAYDGWIYNAGR